MEKGWTLTEIDSMDICYYFRLLGYRPGVQASGDIPKPVTDANGIKGLYIDQFGLF